MLWVFISLLETENYSRSRAIGRLKFSFKNVANFLQRAHCEQHHEQAPTRSIQNGSR